MKKLFLLTKTLLVAVMLCVGTNAWAGTFNATVKMTYVSGSDADVSTSYGEVETAYCGYNKITDGSVELGSKGWGVNNIAYLQVDASALPSGATITAASLAVDCQQIKARGLNYGVGYNSTAWSSTMTWNTADRSITTMGSVISGSKTTTDKHNEFDITSAFSGDADNIVTILVYQTAAGGGYVKNPVATITYSTETVYDITFAETNSVAATVKIGETDVTSGTKLANGNYDFTATATGYQDYEGSFTVSGANKEVSFTMTPKAVYSYTVKAVDGEDNELATITSGSTYEDESVTNSLPWYVLYGGRLYYQNTNSKTTAITSDKQVIKVAYASTETKNVVYYSEGENIAASSASLAIASNGKAGRGVSNKTYTNLGAGKYRIYALFHVGNGTSGNDWGTAYFYKGETEIGSKVLSARTNNQSFTSDEFTLTENTDLKISYPDGNSSGLDYIYIVQTGVAAPISSYGKSTFSSTYPLDIANATPAGLKAYKATAADASKVTMVEVTDAVAGMSGDDKTGLVLVGTPSTTYFIPIATTEGTVPEGNLLFGWNSSWGNLGVAQSGTNFVLSVQDENVVWAPILDEENTAPLATGQAGLWANVTIDSGSGSARGLRMVFDGDVITGINEAAQVAEAAEKDGKFIINGQLVIKKNGKKFNAAGAQLY